MSLRVGVIATFALLCHCITARADGSSITYRARVIHNNRSAMSIVTGVLDPATGDYSEAIDRSYTLDFKQIPAKLEDAQPELPAIWGVGGRTAQRWGEGLPRFDSPLLRHFIVGQMVLHPESVKAGDKFLSGQLEVSTAKADDNSFEIVARLRGQALVVTGTRQRVADLLLPKEMAVLGPSGELYQYLFDEIGPGPAQPIVLPTFDPQHFVSFPTGGGEPVPTRPVKDWLVFQAELPNGRKLNLLFDSGADTMIVDDMVLRLDAGLNPVGETMVDSGISSGSMHLYKNFSFKVGGVEFKNLPVMGGQLTNVALGGGLRIHGIVGGEILQLCQVDLNLAGGTLRLLRPDAPEPSDAQKLPLTFIQQLPHLNVDVQDGGPALLLLDTGQRTGLSLNLDYLDQRKMADKLVMDGFLGGVRGSLVPRYMLEQVQLGLAGQDYTEKIVDATPVNTYDYDGVPVVGAIGFSMLARHFGGLTFDYQRHALYVREPGSDLHFAGQPNAWGPTLASSAFDSDVPPIKEMASAPSAAAPANVSAAPPTSETPLPARDQASPTPSQFPPLPPDPTPSRPKDSPTFRINRKVSGKHVAGAISKHQYYVQPQ